MLPIVVMALAIAAIAARTGAAQPTLGAHVFGSFNTYQMSDVNNAIDDVNATGANFDQIKSGFSGGIGARGWASPNFMLSGHWEPLFASTKSNGETLKLDANSAQFTAGYFFPSGSTYSSTKLGVGAGFGYYWLDGKSEVPGSADVKITGSGPGFDVLGMSEWNVSPGFGVTADAGYRFAKVDIDNSSLPPTGRSARADYSGFVGRLGVAFYLPSGTERASTGRSGRSY
jgi:hypothetical protein